MSPCTLERRPPPVGFDPPAASEGHRVLAPAGVSGVRLDAAPFLVASVARGTGNAAEGLVLLTALRRTLSGIRAMRIDGRGLRRRPDLSPSPCVVEVDLGGTAGVRVTDVFSEQSRDAGAGRLSLPLDGFGYGWYRIDERVEESSGH